MNPELTRQSVHTDPARTGCSHSVHFLIREPCSRSFLWFRRRADQRVIGAALGVGAPASALIPCGNKPLDPRSPVPAALNCFHQIVAIPTAVSTVMTASPDAVDAFAGDPESLPKLAAILAEADVKRESDLAPLKSIVADRPA